MNQIFDTLALYWAYPFVRYALVVGVLIALCSSLLGVTLVLKRFSFIGDGLSHVAFGAMAIAAVLLVVRRVHASGSGLRAELIYGDNNTTMNLPLDVDETYDVDTGYYTVHIQIKDGAARFVDSPCPDHICEGFGWLSNEDQTATCLPARAVLTIVPVS